MNMIHYFEGQLGHLFVIIAFVSSLTSAVAFFKGKNKEQSWVKLGEFLFYIHVLAVLGVMIILLYIINQNYFEYHYVFRHSSKLLPIYYKISCLWEGQEGSFLLWIFWNALLGIVIIRTNKFWKAPVMWLVAVNQLFLTSMILGVVVFEFKIGSSPFMLLRDVLDAPIFNVNPNFIPDDGNGLNPLLQNYWMVIHPPTLFLGFSAAFIPFAYCMSGLLMNKKTEWIRPTLPWAQFAATILGIGILMGAYWAYETLNFGGYWNWDPVENAIYVPWLILIASIHVMIAYKKSQAALRISWILTIASFILILYATFLTRSGILGTSSVHSFTDLGLSGQLLVYLLSFLVFSIFLIIKKWNSIEVVNKQISFYSREFWVFFGVAVLCFMSFQVLVNTSIPVYNQIASLIGFELNMAPAVDTHKAYSMPQLILSVFLLIMSGTGQFFWWKKMDKKKFKSAITIPVLLSLVLSTLIIVIGKITAPEYVFLLIASIYSVVANTSILISVANSNITFSAGSIAHIGIALMLIGILSSSGYSNILSKNYTSMVWSKEFPEEVNRDNLLLFINEPRQMHQYSMTYKGIRKLTKEKGYIDQNKLIFTSNPLKVVERQGDIYDTLTLINSENSYFEVKYVDQSNGKKFTLYPRVQINNKMDMIVYSPDIKKNLSADIYTHVRTFPDPEQEADWSKAVEIKVKIGDTFFINDYVATLEKIQPINTIEGVPIDENDIAVKAIVNVQGEYKNYISEPIFIIKSKESLAGSIEDHVYDLALKLSIKNIIPDEDAIIFNMQSTQKDWIIMEAVKKPWINILWLGTFLLILGLVIAMIRRYLEFTKMRNKGIEIT